MGSLTAKTALLGGKKDLLRITMKFIKTNKGKNMAQTRQYQDQATLSAWVTRAIVREESSCNTEGVMELGEIGEPVQT